VDIPALRGLLALGNRLGDFSAPGVTAIDNLGLLTVLCGLLVPAALENQITAEADLVLGARGIHVVPDIVVNAGGVVVSSFE